MAGTYTKGRIYKIEIAALQTDAAQARTFMESNSLAELTASVLKYGVLEPILFRQDDENKLRIVAGERRVAAAGKGGLKTVPAMYVEGDNHQEISLVENLLREDLTAVEQAEAMAQLMKDRNYTQNQLSEMINKSQSHINEILAINRLPADVKNQCRTNPNIPKYILTEIAKDKTEAGMAAKFQKYMEKQAAQGQPKKTAAAAGLRKELVLIRQVDTLNGKLVDLPWQEWTESDQQDLANVLGSIRQTTGNILQAMGGTNVEEAEEGSTEEDDNGQSDESKPRLA